MKGVNITLIHPLIPKKTDNLHLINGLNLRIDEYF